jgi:hypothetical protein
MFTIYSLFLHTNFSKVSDLGKVIKKILLHFFNAGVFYMLVRKLISYRFYQLQQL